MASTQPHLDGDLQHLASIVESSTDAIIGKTLDGIILSWNAGAERMYGYTATEAIGRSISIITPPDRPRELGLILEAVRAGRRVDQFDTVRVRKDGTLLDVSLTVSPTKDAEGRITGASAIGRDITDRKRAEEEIAYLAYHDRLTGLPNRIMLEDLLGLALARARRRELFVAVIYLDLDQFKPVNDSLGHPAGDELLRQAAARMQEVSRATDVVARVGGDEFLVLVADIETGDGGSQGAEEVAGSVANRLQEALSVPFVVSGTYVEVGTSIGISLYPTHARDAEALMWAADAAMYRNKRAGRSRHPSRGAEGSSTDGNGGRPRV